MFMFIEREREIFYINLCLVFMLISFSYTYIYVGAFSCEDRVGFGAWGVSGAEFQGLSGVRLGRSDSLNPSALRVRFG